MAWTVTYIADSTSSSGTATATYTSGNSTFTYGPALISQTDDAIAQFARDAYQAKNIALTTGPAVGDTASTVQTNITNYLSNLESSSTSEGEL